MRRNFVYLLYAVVLVLLLPRSGAAQSSSGLASMLPDLYGQNAVQNQQIFKQNGLTVSTSQIAAQLEPAFLFNAHLGSQISSLPLGSSAGGFTWTFNPEVGTFTRGSASFGPSFAERALTVGKKKFNFGVNYQHASFNNFEGKGLDEKSIKVYTSAQYYSSTIFIEDSLKMSASSDTVAVFGTVGLTDKLDLGFVVPVMSVKMEAALFGRVGVQPPISGQPALGSEIARDSDSRSASGIGDIVVRAKYRLLPAAGGGLAIGADARLGTGDEMNFLGIPGNQLKVYAIASTSYNKLSPHLNVGFTASGGSSESGNASSPLLDPPNEVNYVGGFDFAVTPKATVAFDLVGRTLVSAGRLVDTPVSFGGNYTQFQLQDGNLNQLLVAFGGKVNVFSNMLASANVLIPTQKVGVTGLTWTVGLDYSF